MKITEIKKQLKELNVNFSFISQNEIILEQTATQEDLIRLKCFLTKNNLEYKIKKVFDVTNKNINDIQKCSKTLKFCGDLIDEIVAIGIPLDDNEKLMKMLRQYMEECNQDYKQ